MVIPTSEGVWHGRFLVLARYVASWSKDPSTKCGAVIVRPDRTVASVGYNGFPRCIVDKPELLADRKEKYPRTVHSEMNAILQAHEPVRGYALYNWPLPPCDRCAAHVLQAGITRIVSLTMSEELRENWGTSCDRAAELFKEASVPLLLIPRLAFHNDIVVQHLARELVGDVW